jgi:hypothetical protein
MPGAVFRERRFSTLGSASMMFKVAISPARKHLFLSSSDSDPVTSYIQIPAELTVKGILGSSA